MKILFYPGFKNTGSLADYLYRAAWYLAPLSAQLSEVRFICETPCTIEELPPPPEELGRNLKEVALGFSKLQISGGGKEALESAVGEADVIFVHEEDTRNELIKRLSAKAGPKIVRVDKEKVQYADSFFLRFAENFSDLQDEFRALALRRSAQLLAPLRRNKCYVFGTGPNFSFIDDVPFDDGLVIACNSIVINNDILNQLQPGLFVIADPIFHAGPSSYAYEFRKNLQEQLRERDCPLIVPMRDYHIYRTYLDPAFLPRLIPIEFIPGDAPNLDVVASPHVTTTSNILSLFQIPLAATLASEILVSGCDGRPLTQNTYFWQHNKKVQLNDQMALIQTAHPAFFNISFDDYYDKHITTLETWISACEARGKRVLNLTPSYIPALQKRQAPQLLEHLRQQRRPLTASIVVPSYNCSAYLEEAVHSLIAEKRDDIEILIIDDFSDDGSYDLAKSLAEQHDCIHVFQNFRGKGVSGARNTGINLAVGRYIGFLDSDDTILPGSLDARISTLDSNPDVHIVHSRAHLINSDSEDMGVPIYTSRDITFRDMKGSGSHFNTIMIRASELQDKLHFDEALSNGEDWLAFARILRLGYVSKYVEKGAANYRVHPESTVLQDFGKHENTLNHILDWVYRPTSEAESTAEFAGGLDPALKARTLLDRKIGELAFQAISGNQEALKALLVDRDFRAYLQTFSGDFGARLKVPAVRATGLHVNSLGDARREVKGRIHAAISILKRYPETVKFQKALDGLFFKEAEPDGADQNVKTVASTLYFSDATGIQKVVTTNSCPDKGQGVLFYEDPVRRVAAAISSGEDPEQALEAWQERTQMLMRLFRANRARIAMVPFEGWASTPSTFKALLSGHGISVQRLPVPVLPEIEAELAVLASEIAGRHSAVVQLHQEMRASSLVPDAWDDGVKASIQAAADGFRRRLADLGALRGRLSALEKQAEALHREKQLQAEQLAQLQATLETHLAAADQVRNEAEDLRGRTADLERRSHEMAEELDRIYRSKSWRVTEPLRGMRRALGRDN